MAEKPADKSQQSPQQALDLQTLSGLDFGPAWADDNAKPRSLKQSDSRADTRAKSKRAANTGARDRRAPQGARSNDARRAPAPRARAGGDSRRRAERPGPAGRANPAPLESTVKVDLYPQDEAFDALVKRLRSTVRTYQLFEIAQLLLEKPERYVVVVENKERAGDKPVPLYFSVPGHLPFASEDAAINHVLANHLDLFFEIEAIEVDPPKGNFQMVNRCPFTAELLGPPNYHRYAEFLKRHYAARVSGISFERYVAKIETVKEQEAIDAWLETMKKGARYTLKNRQEGEPESFESLEAVRMFLLQHRKDQIVGSGETIRFAGRDIERLPKSNLRSSVLAYVEQQQHFPLDTANNIRGRLRRHKFAVYKKGAKGVSFVCAVKRKFRDSQTVFTPSIQGLIEFIEQHPNTPASQLPKIYIGIDTEKQQPAKLEMASAQTSEADRSEAEQAASADNSPEAGPAVDAAASTAATPKAALTEDEQRRLNQLMLDLRWLIVEGYVTEYGDGRLFAAPPLPEAKPKPAREASTPAQTKSTPSSAEALDGGEVSGPAEPQA